VVRSGGRRNSVQNHLTGTGCTSFTLSDGALAQRYTRLTTSNANFSGIGFIHLRRLRKTPFLTTGEAGAQESLKWRDLRFPACGWRAALVDFGF